MPHPFRHLVLALALALFAPVAAPRAQQEIGTLTADLGGEERTWTVVAGDAADGPTSHWTKFMTEVDGLVVAAVAAGLTPPEGALRLEMANTGAFPDRCPCTFRGVEVTLWTGPDAAGPRYASDAAEVVITVAEERSGEAFRIEGTVAGTLLHRADATAEPDPDDALELRGTFVVPRLPRLD